MTDERQANDRKLARDVARHLDRRQMRRRMLRWLFLLVVVILAAGYLRFGNGWLPGSGTAAGPGGAGSGRVETAQPLIGTRCLLRVAPGSITIDGKAVTRDAAVDACKAAGGANIVATGDARHGDVLDMEAALKAAGVDFVELKPPTGSGGSGATAPAMPR